MRRAPVREFLPQLAERSISEFFDDHCSQFASSIAYHVLFSIFPLAVVLAGASSVVVRVTGTRADVVDSIVSNIPLSTSGDRTLRRLLEGATGNLSALGLLGIVGVVYAASGMMTSIRTALDEAWDVEANRPYLKGKLVDLGLIAVAAVLALLSLGVTIALHTAAALAWLGPVLGIVVPLVASFALVLFLYRIVPARRVYLRDAVPAAAFVACVFVLTENLFAIYVQHFTNYNALYGSLGAVIAFMFFVYLSSLTFLFGAEIASEWPRVRDRIERGESGGGEPVSRQLRRIVKGLWVREDQSER